MNNNTFNVTRTEVKTVYSIEIQLKECEDIIAAAKKSPLANIYWLTDRLNLDTAEKESPKVLQNKFASIWNPAHTANETHTIDFIVRLLGFEGVENYGLYDKDKGVIKMSVYQWGDQLN